jgi:hypothetical protein
LLDGAEAFFFAMARNSTRSADSPSLLPARSAARRVCDRLESLVRASALTQETDMHYDEFRAAWDEALHRGKVLSFHDRPEETMDVATMSRTYSVRVGMSSGLLMPGPFTSSMLLGWEWDALMTARFSTTEEDLLRELLGSRKRITTERPWLRVDVEFAGMLPYGHPIRVPSADVWQGWVRETMNVVDPLLPAPRAKKSSEGLPVVEGWLGEPEAEMKIEPSGDLRLLGVKLKAWQAINPPRQWDDPRRRPDASPQEQLESFAKRLHNALNAWKRCLKLLLAIRTGGDAGRRLH